MTSPNSPALVFFTVSPFSCTGDYFFVFNIHVQFLKMMSLFVWIATTQLNTAFNIYLRMAKRSSYMNKQMRATEIERAWIAAMAADPSLKYWLGVGGGILLTAIFKASQGDKEAQTKVEELTKRGVMDFIGAMYGGAAGLVLSEAAIQFKNDAATSPFGVIVGMSATWTGLNAACLLLSSASGGKDGAGILASLKAVV